MFSSIQETNGATLVPCPQTCCRWGRGHARCSPPGYGPTQPKDERYTSLLLPNLKQVISSKTLLNREDIDDFRIKSFTGRYSSQSFRIFNGKKLASSFSVSLPNYRLNFKIAE